MEEHTQWLIPLEGLLVRDPITKSILPKEGSYCTWIGPQGRYWRRRVTDGSVIISTPPKSGVSEKVRRDK
jgi:hypothetical protein